MDKFEEYPGSYVCPGCGRVWLKSAYPSGVCPECGLKLRPRYKNIMSGNNYMARVMVTEGEENTYIRVMVTEGEENG